MTSFFIGYSPCWDLCVPIALLLLSAPALSNWPAITRLVYFKRTVAEMCRPWCLNKVRYRNLVLPERIVSNPETIHLDGWSANGEAKPRRSRRALRHQHRPHPFHGRPIDTLRLLAASADVRAIGDDASHFGIAGFQQQRNLGGRDPRIFRTSDGEHRSVRLLQPSLLLKRHRGSSLHQLVVVLHMIRIDHRIQ